MVLCAMPFPALRATLSRRRERGKPAREGTTCVPLNPGALGIRLNQKCARGRWRAQAAPRRTRAVWVR